METRYEKSDLTGLARRTHAPSHGVVNGRFTAYNVTGPEWKNLKTARRAQRLSDTVTGKNDLQNRADHLGSRLRK